MTAKQPANINSLDELRQRKLKLELEERTAREGLSNTLAETPKVAKEYAVEDLALPAMGVGLAAYVAYRILRSSGSSSKKARRIAHAQEAYEARKDDGALHDSVRDQQDLKTSHTVYPDPPRTAPATPPPSKATSQTAPPPASRFCYRSGNHGISEFALPERSGLG